MHILPDLERLEHECPEGLAVIGVHSAKFSNEKSEFQLENAIKRYGIEHPVCNDVDLSLWNNLGVTCWPTLLLLSPSGIPIHVFIGEGHSDFLFEYTSVALQYFKERGELSQSKLPRSLQSKVTGSSLKYPGKICILKKYLVISDSGNHRVLVIDSSDHTVVHKIGGSTKGGNDGDFSTATFSNPQGLTAIGDDLILVADTDNHLIRQINLETKLVSTVCGTGKQGQDKEGGKQGVEQEISSPWDICKLSEKSVAIAMAGIHQIWLYCLDNVTWWKGVEYPAETLVRIVGSGAEENRNNSYPAKAGLAQPSGLALNIEHEPAGALYVADSESSTIRKIDLKDGAVKNVCGGERDPTNLFGYGDVEGAGVNAKLQHPLAVAYTKIRSELYIADSYNHKIKKVTGPKNNVVTLVGNEPGNEVGKLEDARFCEPGGLCLSEDESILYIADTNNHCIKHLNLDSGEVETLNIKFPGAKAKDDNVVLHKMDLNLNMDKQFILNFTAKHPDYKLNSDAVSTWNLEGEASSNIQCPGSGTLEMENSVGIALLGDDKCVKLDLRCKVYLCSKSSGLCLAKSILHKIEIQHIESSHQSSDINLGSVITN